MSKKLTNDEFLERLKEKGNPNIKIIGKYENAEEKIECECLVNKNHPHWFAYPGNLLRGTGCPYCSKIKTTKEESFGWKHPDLVKFFENKEEAYNCSDLSEKYVILICPTCGTKKKCQICDLSKRGFNCFVCGDNISMPNKIIRNLLILDNIKSQIKNVGFEKKVEGTERLKYDAYFEIGELKVAIEMQGGQHKRGYWTPNTKRKVDIIGNDNIKRKKSKENGILLIEINSECSDFEVIKDNILKSKLKDLINLSCVDWDYLFAKISQSLVKAVSEYYESDDSLTLEKVSKKFNIGIAHVASLLKTGHKLGLTKYDSEDYRRRRKIWQSKFIYVIEEGEEIKEFYGRSDFKKYLRSQIGKAPWEGITDKLDENGVRYDRFIIKRIPNDRYYKKDKNN